MAHPVTVTQTRVLSTSSVDRQFLNNSPARLIVSLVLVALCALSFQSPAFADEVPVTESVESADQAVETDTESSEETKKFKFFSKKPKNLLLVPIPTSNPTFGTGLILGSAYFYKQTEEQEASQPASYTGVAAGYTDNNSWFVGALQQNYWKEDTWRFTGMAGYLDLKLQLNPLVTDNDDTESLDWLVKGTLIQARISRKIRGNWYIGLMARYLDISQTLSLDFGDDRFNLNSKTSATGIGLNLDYDSRDVSFNPYGGRFFELKAINSGQSGDETGSYQTYRARIRSYHALSNSLVLAWDINGCSKSGQIPLWDTCRLALRGFPGTDYLGKQSLYAQAEARWRFHKKWGLVAFAGAGRINDTLAEIGEGDTIPSYGAGLRFMVLESQRINIRLDYARSDKGNDAWYLSVTEAF